MWRKAKSRVERKGGLLSALFLVAAMHTSVVSAQELVEQSPPNRGFWFGGGIVINQPWASQQLARGWERVGDFGMGTGAHLSTGYDAPRLGFSLELESTNTHLGDRPGRNFALAAVLQVPSPWQPSQSWPARISAGYVRYGLGGAYVLPSELPTGYFHSEPSSFADGERLVLLGNGFRMGIEARHPISSRTALVVGIDGDLVHFGSATYQHMDQTLTQSGWGAIPRLALGFVVGRGHRP